MTIIESSPLVSISTLPARRVALKGVKNVVQVLFTIHTSSKPQNITPLPVNLAIVLDRSGSMKTEKKLENCKEAIIGIINQLKSGDLVHLVSYETDVKTIFSNEKITDQDHKERLMSLVRSIETGGSTFLSGGLIEGIKAVEEALKQHQQTPMNNRVFLFSDGLVNKGPQDHESLFLLSQNALEKSNIGTTSFGIGSDFDQDLMKGFSDRGGGPFYYIRNGERIGYFVEQAHQSLTSSVGIKAKLSVQGKGCAVVSKIWGHQHSVCGTASIGDLFENNTRNILVQLDLSPSENTSQLEEVLSWNFEFIPLTSENQTDGQSFEPQELHGTVKMNFSMDKSEVEESGEREVEVVHCLQIVAEEASQALELMKKHHTKEAIEVREKSLQRLKQVLEFDESGQVEISIKHLEATIAEMRAKGATREVVAHTNWEGFTFTRADVGYTQTYGYDFGYDP